MACPDVLLGVAAILAGRRAENLPEGTRHMRLVGKAAGDGDLSERHAALPEQRLCLRHPQVLAILVRRLLQGSRESLEKYGAAQADRRGQFAERELGRQGMAEKFVHLLELGRRQSRVGISRLRLSDHAMPVQDVAGDRARDIFAAPVPFLALQKHLLCRAHQMRQGGIGRRERRPVLEVHRPDVVDVLSDFLKHAVLQEKMKSAGDVADRIHGDLAGRGDDDRIRFKYAGKRFARHLSLDDGRGNRHRDPDAGYRTVLDDVRGLLRDSGGYVAPTVPFARMKNLDAIDQRKGRFVQCIFDRGSRLRPIVRNWRQIVRCGWFPAFAFLLHGSPVGACLMFSQ